MSRRFYLPSTGAAAVSPAFDGWFLTTGADRIAAVTTKISSAMTNKSFPVTGGAYTALARQYVSAPLAAQTISGTVTSYIRALETTVGDGFYSAISIRVCNNGGTSFTGTLLTLQTLGTSEFDATTLTNRLFASAKALSSLAINDGDRLVMEFGAYGGVTSDGNLNFGDNSATDLPQDQTTTAANNPWIEFSQTLTFQGSAGHSLPIYLQAVSRAAVR